MVSSFRFQVSGFKFQVSGKMAETNEYREQRLQSMKTLAEMGYEPYGCKYDH